MFYFRHLGLYKQELGIFCGIHNYATQKGNYFLHAHQPLVPLAPVDFAQDRSAIAHKSFLSAIQPH